MPRAVAKAAFGNAVEQAYARSDMLDRRRQMMDPWAGSQRQGIMANRSKRSRTKNERLTESEWQVLYAVEARFPGFSRRIREKYWDLVDNSSVELTEFEIAKRIRHEFYPDITDRSLEDAKNSGPPETLTSKDVRAWLEQVLVYQTNLEGLSSEQLHEVFKQAVLAHDFDIPVEPDSETESELEQEIKDYETKRTLLVLNEWTKEQATEFLFLNLKGESFEDIAGRIDKFAAEEKVDFPISPVKFWRKAKEARLQGFPNQTELAKIAPDLVDFSNPKRLTSLYAMIYAAAFGRQSSELNPYLSKDVSVAGVLFDKALVKVGMEVNKQTVRAIIEDARSRYSH